MKSKSIWLIIGFGMFASVLGFLVGASNSPVLGVVLSSLFGIVVALLGLIEKEQGKSFKIKLDQLSLVGKALFGFSILLLIGILFGDNYRNNNLDFLKQEQSFPWKDNAPESTYEAFDWIVASQKLKQIGYSQEQITLLYEIRLKEIEIYKAGKLNDTANSENDPYNFDKSDSSGYDKTSPFNTIISTSAIESSKAKRGPASED